MSKRKLSAAALCSILVGLLAAAPSHAGGCDGLRSSRVSARPDVAVEQCLTVRITHTATTSIPYKNVGVTITGVERRVVDAGSGTQALSGAACVRIREARRTVTACGPLKATFNPVPGEGTIKGVVVDRRGGYGRISIDLKIDTLSQLLLFGGSGGPWLSFGDLNEEVRLGCAGGSMATHGPSLGRYGAATGSITFQRKLGRPKTNVFPTIFTTDSGVGAQVAMPPGCTRP